jgi:hypothetical protein
VIAEGTRKLLGNLFELEDLAAKDLKGIAGPVRAWAANHRQRLWIPLADVWERAAIGPIQVTWLLRECYSMADGHCSRSFPIASRSPRDVSGGAQ